MGCETMQEERTRGTGRIDDGKMESNRCDVAFSGRGRCFMQREMGQSEGQKWGLE